MEQHCLSLPIFLLFIPDLKRGFAGLAGPSTLSAQSLERFGALSSAVPYAILGANMLTQLACVSGVNQLSSVSPPHSPSYVRFPVLTHAYSTYRRCRRTWC